MIWHPDWTSVLTGQPIVWISTGFVTTLLVTLAGSLLATAIMLLLLALRVMPGHIGRLLVIFLVSLFRNTPLLIQLFFWYFVAWTMLPISWRDYLVDDHSWATLPGGLTWLTPEFICAAWGLAAFSAVYLLEELQAGINALSAGQREAAIAQGFSHLAILRHILLPQGIRNAWQPLVGQYLNLMKLSSLTSAIGFGELTYYISQIESYNSHALEGFAIGTALYLLLGLTMGGVLLRLGPRSFQRRERRGKYEF